MVALAGAVEAGCHDASVSTPTSPSPNPPPIAPDPARVAPRSPPRPAAAFAQPFACAAWLDELRAALAADSVERRVTANGQTWPDQGETAGTPCKTAKDEAACRATLARPTPPSSLWRPCGNCAPTDTALVVTRGDDVRVASSQAELIAMFGPVDTPAEAFVLVDASNHRPACEGPWVRATAAGFEVKATTLVNDCPMQTADLVVAVARDGKVTVVEKHLREPTGGCAGRRPPGLVAAAARAAGGAVGRYFAALARLEAASVVAFEVLARELRAHGAPRRLPAAAARARDEVAHAAAMGALRAGSARRSSRRARAAAPCARCARSPSRTREGCVRETWRASRRCGRRPPRPIRACAA